MGDREYILESRVNGRFMKMVAVDPETGLEVSVMGDPTERLELERLAVQKLEQQLAKMILKMK